MEAVCTPFSFEAAGVPHATTRLASFLWTEGACLVALWFVGSPHAAEAACDVILFRMTLP